ncbi:MAG TPA: dihydrolipoamide acetyltransferase family protein [Tepidiformaceae bacterium]|nr:dihydrolipoamide acetyltransferase family protein [Tepidiformaceae bacterium]
MAVEVTMPQMGADMTEGTLLKWVKQIGDSIQRGEVIAEIETDKATIELEAYESGTLIKLVAQEGDVVPVGDVIALLGEPSEAPPDIERKPPAETPARRAIEPEVKERAAAAAAATAPPAPPPTEAPTATETDGRVRISPVARRIAREAGLDVSALRGSGPDGRILRRDVEAALAAATKGAPASEPAAAPPAAAPARPPAGLPEGLSKMRQAIARRMTLSKQTQPHYYLTLDIDMTAALGFREQFNASATDEQRVSINDLVVKACAIALERHPKFNAAYSEEGLVHHERVNVCIGIALDDGLIAPALLDCQSKSLGRIAVESKDLINRAKTGHLKADEYSDGTFTITNLGAFGVETLIGIINPPQAAILGVGSVMPQAVVRDGQVVVRQVMKVALSADHRVSDGAEGARFIKEIQALLEGPAALAL